MQHEEHSQPAAPGFGTNTNGLGIFIVAIVAVCLALFCWNYWKDASRETELYRWDASVKGGHGHGEGHEAAGHGEEHATTEAAPSHAHATLADPAALGTLDTVTGNFILSVGDNIKITLPDSAKTVLEVGANSTEAKLFHFLSDAGAKVNETDKTQGWITSDRIYFETGKAGLTAESKKQISNLALILKAFPTAEVKVGGYTDNTGSADANVKVSGERATAVQKAIVAAGAKNAIAAEGYGPEHPIANNSTKEGQALNRRVDLRVTKK
jgi:OOP family OmpA-OmpF porin